MREPRQVTATSTRAHALVGAVLLVAAVVTLLFGRVAFSVYVGVVMIAAFVDLRRLLGESGHPLTLVLGAAGVAGFLWSGYEGSLILFPSVMGALVLAMLITHIAVREAGARSTDATADLSATLGAAGLVGVLGAHVLLIREVPRFGFRGLLAFGAMALTNEIASFVVGRWKGRRALNRQVVPQKTWEGAIAGFAASVVAGLVVGLVSDPPFGISSGLTFGALVGVLVPLGDLGFAAIKRSAGVRHSGTYLGAAGGALDVVNGVVFAAPAFYWAFRTIAM